MAAPAGLAADAGAAAAAGGVAGAARGILTTTQLPVSWAVTWLDGSGRGALDLAAAPVGRPD